MIQCTKCNLQYIGETKRRLKDRFNEHRRPIINPFCSYTPTAVSGHFLTSGHAEDHMILIPLEQLHTSRDSEKLVRHSLYTEEKHWSLQALTEEMKCNLI